MSILKLRVLLIECAGDLSQTTLLFEFPLSYGIVVQCAKKVKNKLVTSKDHRFRIVNEDRLKPKKNYE